MIQTLALICRNALRRHIKPVSIHLIKSCAVCGAEFTSVSATIDTCSRVCGHDKHQRHHGPRKQMLSPSAFNKAMGDDPDCVDLWRARLRAFRLAHHLRLREMALLLGYRTDTNQMVAALESGKRAMTPLQRLILLAMEDGWRPPNWPRDNKRTNKF